MSMRMKPFDHDELLKLDGDVPFVRSAPYGIQHILAMFVSNLAPITIIAGAAQHLFGAAAWRGLFRCGTGLCAGFGQGVGAFRKAAGSLRKVTVP